MKVKRMCLDDYKLVSTYGIKDGVKPEWEAQLNIYALMVKEHGRQVDRLRIIAILRDWQKAKAKHTPDYPQAPVAIVPVRMWPAEQTEEYIKQRLIAHGKAQHELPECTPEERWEKTGAFAIRKQGGKRAAVVVYDKESAETALAAYGKDYEIQQRPSEQKRCEAYCSVLKWCDFGQGLLSAAENFRQEQSAWVVGRPRASAAQQ
jgi:hypothetical protein